MRPSFDAPVLGAVREEITLTPETLVGVRFRGGPPIVDMYDSREYVIPPAPAGVSREEWRKTTQPASEWQLPYGLALHFRDRNIVPATRQPFGGGSAASQLAIIWTPTGKNIDTEAQSAPFTAEQIKLFGYPEALDRSTLTGPDAKVKVLPVSAVLSQGQGMALESNPDAYAPPDVNEAIREASHSETEAEAAGERVSRTRGGRTQFRKEPDLKLPGD